MTGRSAVTLWLASGIAVFYNPALTLAQQSTAPEPKRSAMSDVVVVGWQAAGPRELLTLATSVDWVRNSAAGNMFSLGGGSFGADTIRWTLGRVGVGNRLRPWLSLFGNTAAGTGTAATEPITYLTLRGDAVVRVHRVLSVTAGDEYIRIGDTKVNLLRAGARWQLKPRLSLDTQYGVSRGTDSDTRFLVTRVDTRVDRLDAFGGLSVGRTASVMTDLVLSFHSRPDDVHEIFVGAGVPLSQTVLTVAIDRQVLSVTPRYSVTVNLRLQLR